MSKLKSIKNLVKAFSPKPWPLEKPTVIQFPVNDICNSKCQMCHIWKQKRDNEISPDELKNALTDPLYSEVNSVGLNGGEPTLREDLADIAETLFNTLPSIKNISLITNGINFKQVTKRIDELGKVVNSYNGNLDVMVSLDGVGEVHDIVRGRPGNFDSACKVLDFSSQHDTVNSVRIGCTVIKSNIYGVYDLLDYARSKNIYIKYRLGVAHPRLYTNNIHEPFELTSTELLYFCTFLESLIVDYETSLQQKLFYRSLINQLIFHKNREASCDWQHRGATISSRGELSYCAIASPTLGEITKTSSSSLYFKNIEKLNFIRNNYCDTCKHDYMGLPRGSEVLRNYMLPKVKNIINKSLQNTMLFNIAGTYNNKLKYNHYKNKINIQNNNINNEPVNSSNKKNNNEVLLCGWYGTETLGDKALLAGIVGALKNRFSNTSFCIASLNPHITRITVSQIPELHSIRVLALDESFSEIKLAKLLVFAGGPIMAIHELAAIEKLFSIAKHYKVPSLIAGCGVGPMSHQHHTDTIKNILNLADRKIYRDSESLELVKSLGLDTSQDIVAEDPSLSWIESTKISKSTHEKTGLSLVLGLREWPYAQYARNLSKKQCLSIQENFESMMIKGLQLLIDAHPQLKITPIPMSSNHYGGNDIWYYHKLFYKNNIITSKMDYSALRKDLAPQEALNYFSNANAILAMRFHSLVFALGTETPAVAIDYTMGTGKVSALANKYNIPCKPIDEIDSEFIFENLNMILDSNSNYDQAFPSQLFFKNAVLKSLTKIST